MSKLPPLPPGDHPALGGPREKRQDAEKVAADIDRAAQRLRSTIGPSEQDDAPEPEAAPRAAEQPPPEQPSLGAVVRRLFGRGR